MSKKRPEPLEGEDIFDAVPMGDSAFDAVPKSWHGLEGAALAALDLINQGKHRDAHDTLLEALDDVDWERREYEGLLPKEESER